MNVLLIIIGIVLAVVGVFFAIGGLGEGSAGGGFKGLKLEGPPWLILVAIGVGVMIFGAAWDFDDDGPTTTAAPEAAVTTSTTTSPTPPDTPDTVCQVSGQVLREDASTPLPNVGVFFAELDNLNQPGARPERTRPDGRFDVECSGFEEDAYPLTVELLGADWCRGRFVTGETVARNEERDNIPLYVPDTQIEGTGVVCLTGVDLMEAVVLYGLVEVASELPRFDNVQFVDLGQLRLATTTTSAP